MFLSIVSLTLLFIGGKFQNGDGNKTLTPLQRMAEEPDLSIVTQVLMSASSDGEVSSSLSDPSFGGIICAPTDDAFFQFFDETQTTQDDLLRSQDLIDELAAVSVIPAGQIPGGMPEVGQNLTADTLAGSDRIFIELNANYKGELVGKNGTTAKSAQQCGKMCMNMEACNTFVYCGEEDGCNNNNLNIKKHMKCDLKFQALVLKREIPEAWYIGPDTEFTSGFVWRGEQLFVSRNDNGKVTVQSAGGSEANMVDMIQQTGDGMIWKLDEVLKSRSVDAILQDAKGEPTPVQIVSSLENATVMSAVLKTGVTDQQLQNSLSDPTFGGIICVPTDDAFNQFFDEQQITQDEFLQSQDLIDEFVTSNVIPSDGLPGGIPTSGNSATANTFAGPGGELQVQRSDSGDVTIQSTGETTANMLQMIMQGDTRAWKLDKVLKSSSLNTLLQNTPISVVSQEPDLTTLTKIFTSDNINTEAANLVSDPTFGGIICAPTDDAFVQFFDQQQTTQEEFIQSENQLNELVDIHIIPEGGLPGGMPPPGQSVNATTLHTDQQLIISRSDDGDVTITDPKGVTAVLVSNVQRGDAVLWKLDAVFQPKKQNWDNSPKTRYL